MPIGVDASPAQSPLRKKLDIFYALNEREHAALEAIETGTRVSFSKAEILIAEGDPLDWIYVVQRGWAMSYKLLDDGRRQILAFALPGDFISLDATLFTQSDSAVSALTDIEVSRIDPADMVAMMANYPQLALAIAWCAARDDSILAEHVVSTGRRSAYEALAHLFVELWRRLAILDLTENRGYRLPISQSIIADSLGLSFVHINRTLRRLRDDGLIDLSVGADHLVEILDMAGLEAVAGFHEGYLHFTEMPRSARKTLEPYGN